MQRAQTDQQWAAQRVDGLPTRWQGRILAAWERRRRQVDGSPWAEQEAQRAANVGLRETVDGLDAVRVPLDASDTEICQRAQTMAERCAQLAQLYREAGSLRAAMARLTVSQGVEPPEGENVTDGGAMARMVDPLWWRRQLRKQHAKEVEAAAIALGLVNKTRDLYVSQESLLRRQQQNARNAEALEGTTARNELGQEFTLAELAAKGTANKAIRRAELMTRISGFERIARDLGHAGMFMTITCPSRMHRWRTVAGGRVIENPRYDGTTPIEANRYLGKVWARIRAKLGRVGVGLYGFRIAEPQHDGTPHWHFLVFHQAGHLDALTATVRRYALADSPTEPGANAHRCDFKPIDWSQGTAAGYIAKYVAKNIDGYRVGEDLFGNDAIETSARVEAWAATWGIRQFQQVGGPPVGPWRELRRVAAIPEGAPAHLRQAHNAVNKTAVIEGRESASVAWNHYCQAQGGVFAGRDYRIRISYREAEGVGRYGEPLGVKPVGVETVERETYTPAWMAHMGGKAERLVTWFVESARHCWEIVGRMGRAARGLFNGAQRPWTRVNNCTEGEPENGKSETGGDQNGGRQVGSGAGPHQSDGSGLRRTAVEGDGGDQRGTGSGEHRP